MPPPFSRAPHPSPVFPRCQRTGIDPMASRTLHGPNRRDRTASSEAPKMETQALRLLIRQKVSDGRLPRGGVAKVWGARGDGQHCHGCDEVVTKTDFIMEGPILNDGRSAR